MLLNTFLQQSQLMQYYSNTVNSKIFDTMKLFLTDKLYTSFAGIKKLLQIMYAKV